MKPNIRYAEFIGKDGSMGLTTGCTYQVEEKPIHDRLIWLYVNGEYIPYESVIAVLNNWRFF